MTEIPRRGITRSYVRGLIAAVTILALALVVASWGLITLSISRPPISTPGIGVFVAQVLVAVALILLVWTLWSQALALLRGRRAMSWSHTVALVGGAYLVWCLGGMAFGMTVRETWLSPFALALTAICGVSTVIFWAVLARRVYTDSTVPKWPWERRGELGPDWNNADDAEMWRRAGFGDPHSGDPHSGDPDSGDSDSDDPDYGDHR